MRKLRQKIIILFGSISLLLGGFCLAHGQYRSVRVYNAGIYNNTRNLMSRRAAMRKVIKKRQQAARKPSLALRRRIR